MLQSGLLTYLLTPLMLCALILYSCIKSGPDLQFKVDSEGQKKKNIQDKKLCFNYQRN